MKRLIFLSMAVLNSPEDEIDNGEDGNDVKDDSGYYIMGIRITRNSTGATLFLPSPGYCKDTQLGYFSNSQGYYWTSSLNLDKPFSAYYLGFWDKESDSGYHERMIGLAVRPVYAD